MSQVEVAPPTPTLTGLLDAGCVPGLAIGRLSGGATSVTGHGDVRPDAIFEIGSVTKSFTALLLAELSISTGLPLDAALQGVMGAEALRLPPRLREATLIDLATHTSGLPRLPARMLARALGHPTDPYGSIGAHDVLALAPRYSRRPRQAFRYSNYGYMLLGRALECATGESLSRLLGSRVCAPLGLKDTGFALTSSQISRCAEARNRRGRPVALWHPGGAPAAGGLRSTAADLLRFVAAFLGQAPPSLERAVAITLPPRVLLQRQGRGVALGWFTAPLVGPRYYMHNGGTAGAAAFCGFDRRNAAGLVVLVPQRHWSGLDSAAIQDLRALTTTADAGWRSR
jgi:D-alanyl-D-alanine-carboxypeptidase/D-alanyl-D-alanine-endopeptidase